MKADLLTLVAFLQRLAVRPWEEPLSLDDYNWLCELVPSFGSEWARGEVEAGRFTVATTLNLTAPALLHTEGGNTRPGPGGTPVTVDVNGFDVLAQWADRVLRENQALRRIVGDRSEEIAELQRKRGPSEWGYLAGAGLTRAQRKAVMRSVINSFKGLQ